jgi:predicted metal-binding membrane protein
MWLSKKTRNSILFGVLGLSLLIWVLLLFNPGNIMTIEHCTVPSMVMCSNGGVSEPAYNSLQMLLQLNPFYDQLTGWGVMVVAMMLPKLIAPIEYIYIRSLKRYRFRLAVLFVLGYLSTWMLAGVMMTAIILGFNYYFPMSYLPAIIIGIVAAVYQCSPLKQRFLNLGHDHWSLPAFGFAAFRATYHYGFVHGIWCVGSGWALMLFPMLLPEWHNIAMITVTLMMISEHLEHPKPLRWGFNPRLMLFKYLVAQVKMRLMYAKV